MKYLFSDENMPKNEIKEYREGFIGGGSPAIAFTKANPNVPVWVNDKVFLTYIHFGLYCAIEAMN